MMYREFAIETTEEAEDIVSDIILKYTDQGVSVSSSRDVAELVSDRADTFDYIDESLVAAKEHSVVKACFPVESADKDFGKVFADIKEAEKNACGAIDFGSLFVTSRDFDNDEWIDNWRKFFKPIEFGVLCVVPSWIDYKGDKTKVVIGTDLAFGTGEHETTSMCVGFLEEYVKVGQTVVDVGTGSGILGICAAKLGAKKVYMTDNDPQAVAAAENNIVSNEASSVCSVMLDTDSSDIKNVCDVAVANITAEILSAISDTIVGYLKRSSVLILSGILNDRVSVPVSAFSRFGFTVEKSAVKGEWTALVMRRA